MDWDKIKNEFTDRDYTKYSDVLIPEDHPPMTNWLWAVVASLFIGGLVGTIFDDVGYLILAITAILYILMIDSSLQLNYQIRQHGMAKADYLVALGIGGIIILFNMIIWTTYFSAIQFPLTLLISGLVFTTYELILMTLVRLRLDTDRVYVEKHPKKPALSHYHIFTEEKYIPLLEESAKESAANSEE